MHSNHSPDTATETQQRAEDGRASPVEATSAVEAVPDKVVEDIVEDIVEVTAEIF